MDIVKKYFFLVAIFLIQLGDTIIFLFQKLLTSLSDSTHRFRRILHTAVLGLKNKYSNRLSNLITYASLLHARHTSAEGKDESSVIPHAIALKREKEKKHKKKTSRFLPWQLMVMFLKRLRVRWPRRSRDLYSQKRYKPLTVSKKLSQRPYTMSFFSKLKFFFFGILFSTVFIFFPLVVFIFASDLPSPYNLSVSMIPQTTKIYDRNNVLLYEIFANQNRSVVKLSQVPQNLRNATIAIEDKDFYSHIGFDIRGILRATVSNFQRNSIQGGSTITQQLIKSAFFSPEPSIQRKIKEVILAFWAERIYSKEQILELYFNYVPYGGTAWGAEAASQVYFGKKVSDLDLAQSAFLAGIPKAPSLYSPYSSTPTLWKERQKEVLFAMVKQGYISKEQANEAEKENLTFKSNDTYIRAPHFVMYVKDLLIQQYGLSQVERGGLRVKTTLDTKLQDNIQKVVSDEVENDSYLNISNGASVVTNPQSGEILAMVGSRDYFDTEHDGNVNITLRRRQPGSTIKLVTYTLALSSGLTEATIIDDSPISIPQEGGPTYTPVNYDGKFHGKLPIRITFANSFNIPAVKVAQQMGVTRIADFGKQMGITSWGNPQKYGLSITLGGAETTMLDLATIYGTVANSGQRVDLNPLIDVTDSQGNVLYKRQTTPVPVVNPGVAFIISDILADNNARSFEFGPNSPLNIPGRRVSVKTGTTDNKRDNWTVGFTKNYVVATWVGNNDNSPMSPYLASGITGAAPMWNRIMTDLLKNTKDEPVEIPNVVVKKFCNGRDAYFIRGTENTVSCGVTPSVTPVNR